MARLLKSKQGRQWVTPAHITHDPTDIKPLLQQTAWRILHCLAETDKYPAQIANELHIHEQTVYYHIRQLERAGIIHVARTEEQHGSLTKYYTLDTYAFALELPYGEEKTLNRPITEADTTTTTFISPHVSGGQLNTSIVVGSPDPHGPYQVRGRDAHCAIDIAAFLGQYGTTASRFLTQLDVSVKAQGNMHGNHVLVGGPLTNLMTGDINAYLPVQFVTEHFPFHRLHSEYTDTVYSDPLIGVIEKLPNPVSPNHSILLIAGNRYPGTIAAILGLTSYTDTILSQYTGEDRWSCVVQGKDLDGDGSVDDIDVLE